MRLAGREDDDLQLFMAPGDVLVVRASGGGRLLEMGNAGGFMGHVMVALSTPHRVSRRSPEGEELDDFFPSADVSALWRVRTLESARRESGLHEADLLFYVEPRTRQLFLVAEVDESDEVWTLDCEAVELWQSPEEPRSDLQPELMVDVVAEMKARPANWSAMTAARAVLAKVGMMGTNSDKAKTMHEIRACWESQPICTSVAIGFWQRYLCKVALAKESDVGVDDVGVAVSVHSEARAEAARLELILKYMPVKADRELPGHLVHTMRECGWVCVAQLPRTFRRTA